MLKKQLLIIIPARGGSKSIKNKNILKINKIPLIVFSFKSAKKLKEKSKIIHCSTDSKKIQRIANQHKIFSTPLRPKKISGNYSRDLDFVNHTLKIYRDKNITFKFGLILRPTNPIRSKKNLDRSFRLFKKNKNAHSLKSVYPSRKTPYKSWTKKNKFINPVSLLKNMNESFNSPRQLLPKTFDQTGTYEYFRINFKTKLFSISGKKIMFFDVDEKESLDIDNLKDINILKN